MAHLRIESYVDHPLDMVKANFGEALFRFLQPSFPPNALIQYDGDEVGGLVEIRLGVPPLAQKWISEIVSKDEGVGYWEFIDEGKSLPFPLKSWRHIHRLEAAGEEKTKIIDDITYSTHAAFMDSLLLPIMKKMFGSRKTGYPAFFKMIAH